MTHERDGRTHRTDIVDGKCRAAQLKAHWYCCTVAFHISTNYFCSLGSAKVVMMVMCLKS